MQIIIATSNAHKVLEFEQLLSGLSQQVDSAAVVGGMPTVEENGTTFEANAKLKADAVSALAPLGAYVLADDSGLEVDFLDGAPGVYSARYAGTNADDATNLNKLLTSLYGVESSRRSARFRCVLCLRTGGGKTHFFEGSCEGAIAKEPRGNQGFGYDPIFIPEGYQKSFGELGEAVKGLLSHRSRAIQGLRDFLAAVH